MRKKLALLGAIFGAGAVLYSCGGGGGGVTPTASNTLLATYITDAPADQYPVFQATIYEIRLCNDTGCEVLFSDNTGIQVDLTDLRGVMRYLGTVNIPQGVYTSIEIYVSQQVSITKNNGTTLNVSFTNFTGQNVSVTCDQTQRCTIAVSATIDTTQTDMLTIDFNLGNFMVDENRNEITQVDVKPVQPDPNNNNNNNQNQQPPMYDFEVTGIVQSIAESSSSFVIAWRDREFTINVTPNTLYDDITGISDLQVGYCVEVEVNGNPAQSQTLTALEVEVESLEECGISEEEEEEHVGRRIDDDYYDDERDGRRERVGRITGIDVQNNQITLGDGTTLTLDDNVVCEIEVEGGMNPPANPGNPGDTHNPNNPSNPGNPADSQNPNNPANPDNPSSPANPGNPANPEGSNNHDNANNPNVGSQSEDDMEEYVRGAQNCANRIAWLLDQGMTNIPAEFRLNNSGEVIKLEVEMEVGDDDDHYGEGYEDYPDDHEDDYGSEYNS